MNAKLKPVLGYLLTALIATVISALGMSFLGGQELIWGTTISGIPLGVTSIALLALGIYAGELARKKANLE